MAGRKVWTKTELAARAIQVKNRMNAAVIKVSPRRYFERVRLVAVYDARARQIVESQAWAKKWLNMTTATKEALLVKGGKP